MNATEKSPTRPAARPRALIATREPALRVGIRLALEPQVEFAEAGSTAEAQLLQAVRSGAVGYLSESVAPGRLREVGDSVLRGEAVVPRALVRRLCEELRTMAAGGSRRAGDGSG